MPRAAGVWSAELEINGQFKARERQDEQDLRDEEQGGEFQKRRKPNLANR
jgi:hypothetical protein